jgi:glycosyltransferase involved in cell wall biosynthesis
MKVYANNISFYSHDFNLIIIIFNKSIRLEYILQLFHNNTVMNKRISVIIPVYNGSSTIEKCLGAAVASEYDNFEIIVIDDCSIDNTAEIINKFPCIFLHLDKNSGASKARNTGARNSTGDILFFIDADCILQKDTLKNVNKAFKEFSLLHPPLDKGERGGVVIGGTYTKVPYDDVFFSTFQSIFINYSETKKKEPDYIASHAMAIESRLFAESNGFPERFLPIIEDVEFSHRLRKTGIKLMMLPEILVQHIFDFDFSKSLKNAFRKSKYWTAYSLGNNDVLSDSGTASLELKANVSTFFLNALLIPVSHVLQNYAVLLSAILFFSFNLFLSRGLIRSFFDSKGLLFSVMATLYYSLVYPFAVGAGAFSGIIEYIKTKKKDT